MYKATYLVVKWKSQMKSVSKVFPFLLLVVAASTLNLHAQQACRLPALHLRPSEPNIFSSQQEQELGDIVAQPLGYLQITNDPAVTRYMAKIGDRLARQFPTAGFGFQYFLVESPVADAFSIPGGHIYITRGMVAQLRSPDELAAILGHEMGHIVTHQGALETTFLLEHVLGVTHVSDRRDIQKKLDALEANWRRDQSAFRKVALQRGPRQLLADKMGLYALTAAGFSPEVYPELFKRINPTGASTGNWFSDLFHTTTPEQIRLRAILEAEQAMPKACLEQQAGTDAQGFLDWRKEALDFHDWTQSSADLHGVMSKVKLEPLTVETLDYLRFSPDGKYLLATKGRNIYIFESSPLGFLFRIYAPNVKQPRFTTDSRSVAFTSAAGRVQVWDLTSRKREFSYTPQLSSSCSTSVLSPDAKTLACLRNDGTLDLIQLPAGRLVLEKRKFIGRPRGKNGFYSTPRSTLSFSPDGRYFLGLGQSKPVAFDLAKSESMRLPSDLRNGLVHDFQFLNDNRLVTASFPKPPGPPAGRYPLAV